MGSNRLINFCHPKLCSTVSCNTCCSENHEETNLLSPDPAKLLRGFMADRFIKPPVEIKVTFNYPVNLSCISLWPRVGQQKSNGFELYSDFCDGTNTMTERISVCYLSECDEGVLFFCPRKFGREKSFDFTEQPKFKKRPFSWQKMSAISDVKSITVKIVRTNSSSVPALGKIEIWGLPGFHTTNQEKRGIWNLWGQRQIGNWSQLQQADPAPQIPSAVPGTSKESTLTSTSLDIPEEFLDGLTFEIMSVPMVLPSGKVVDQRTLERHQDTEANWGRPPSDPFTGRVFTASLHPVLDTALKSRIDHFLVVHQDKEELRFIPRTLGRKDEFSNIANSQASVLALTQKEKPVMLKSQLCSVPCQKHNLSQCIAQNVSSLVNNSAWQSSKNLSKITQNTSNVRSSTDMNSKKRACSPEVTIISENIIPNKSLKVEKNRPQLLGTVLKSDSKPHQKDDDLDDALTAVLNGLPSFVNIDKRPQTTPDNCCNCESKDNLFKLPCKHLVCRVCLVSRTKSAQPSCYVCHCNFTSNQPVKYHLST